MIVNRIKTIVGLCLQRWGSQDGSPCANFSK